MNREYHRAFSPTLNRDMELLIFGHAGLPVVVFPTSMGRFYEFEDRGMVGTLSGSIESGFIQLFCVDSIDGESWYNRMAHPRHRVERHLQYERYLTDEIIPWMRSRAGREDGRIATTGCSLGAFQAALLALRHPQAVGRLIALSGKYDNSSFLDGYSDDLTYFTNPLAFIPGLHDPHTLELLRRMDIVVVSGSTDPHIEEARQLSRILWEKSIPNNLDVWDGWVHDWPYWKSMIAKYL